MVNDWVGLDGETETLRASTDSCNVEKTRFKIGGPRISTSDLKERLLGRAGKDSHFRDSQANGPGAGSW